MSKSAACTSITKTNTSRSRRRRWSSRGLAQAPTRSPCWALASLTPTTSSRSPSRNSPRRAGVQVTRPRNHSVTGVSRGALAAVARALSPGRAQVIGTSDRPSAETDGRWRLGSGRPELRRLPAPDALQWLTSVTYAKPGLDRVPPDRGRCQRESAFGSSECSNSSDATTTSRSSAWPAESHAALTSGLPKLLEPRGHTPALGRSSASQWGLSSTKSSAVSSARLP